MSQWLVKLLGFLLTVIALSLGAQFRFDVLNKIARLRSTGPPPPPASDPGPPGATST
jgi:hypothetical protein